MFNTKKSKDKGNVVKDMMSQNWLGVNKRESGEEDTAYDPELEKLKLARSLKDCVEKTVNQGELFLRDPIAQGGSFRRRYISLVGGRLDIFNEEADMSNMKNPINLKPVKLYQYRFSRNPQDYTRKFFNVGSILKETVTGNKGDFLMQDVILAPNQGVDLETAFEQYRFALVPTSIDELSHKEVHSHTHTHTRTHTLRNTHTIHSHHIHTEKLILIRTVFKMMISDSRIRGARRDHDVRLARGALSGY